MSSKGNRTQTKNGTAVAVPERKIPAGRVKPPIYGVPLKGMKHTLGVYDAQADRFLGYVLIEHLSKFRSVKEWLDSQEARDLSTIKKFIE